MWKKVGFWAVGGLREIGFKNGTDYLMVLGGGRGIFDCIKNEKIARDRTDYYHYEWNMNNGIVKGFNLFEGEEIICGGFEYKDILKKITSDGWSIKIENGERLDYKKEIAPCEIMYLFNQESKQKIETQTFFYGINRAYGFSDTGKSFVVATSSDLHIWNRG